MLFLRLAGGVYVKCVLFIPTWFCDYLIFNQLRIVLSRQIWYFWTGRVTDMPSRHFFDKLH